MSNLFELATRGKYRFYYRGTLSAEDLCDLAPEALDKIYQALREEQKSQEKESLLKKRTAATTLLNHKVELVKHIVEVKLAEAEAKVQRKAKADERKRIKELLANKQDQELQNLSAEELQKKLEELED